MEKLSNGSATELIYSMMAAKAVRQRCENTQIHWHGDARRQMRKVPSVTLTFAKTALDGCSTANTPVPFLEQ